MLRNIFRVQLDNIENDVHMLHETSRLFLSAMWYLNRLEVPSTLKGWANETMKITPWNYHRATSYLFLC